MGITYMYVCAPIPLRSTEGVREIWAAFMGADNQTQVLEEDPVLKIYLFFV